MAFIDPKPYGCFMEYTMKPILDEVREILELCDNDYKSLKHAFGISVAIFLIERIISAIVSITCTGVICWTIYRILLASPNILK